MLKVCQHEREKLDRTRNQKAFSLADIETTLADLGASYTVSGSKSGIKFKGLADIKSATEDELSFCSSSGVKAIHYISESKAGAILCKKQDIEALMDLNKRKSYQTLVFVDNPRLAFIHVAHNVRIGANTVVTAGVVIGGSTIVGDTCWLGLNSTLKNKIKIGRQVIVGSGASVIHDIADEDIVAGVPAKSIKNKVTCDKLFLMAGQGNLDKRIAQVIV